jgi:hypothetical protein
MPFHRLINFSLWSWPTLGLNKKFPYDIGSTSTPFLFLEFFSITNMIPTSIFHCLFGISVTYVTQVTKPSPNHLQKSRMFS